MNPKKVLVADDEPNIVISLEFLMKREGYAVQVARDGEEALEAVRRDRPDLVLLDVMLPDADGFDILMRMRQHPALKNMPVIMLTGKATRQAVIKGMAAGADGYLTKPFEPESVMRAVRTVLGLEEDRPGRVPASDPWVNADAKRLRTSTLRP